MKTIRAIFAEFFALGFACLPVAGPCLLLVGLFWTFEGDGIFSVPVGTVEERAYYENVQRETDAKLKRSMEEARATAKTQSRTKGE